MDALNWGRLPGLDHSADSSAMVYATPLPGTGPVDDPLFAVIAEHLDPFLRDARDRGRALPAFVVEAVRKRVERLLIARGLDEDVPIDEEDGELALQAASIEGRLEKAWGTEPAAEAPDDPSAAVQRMVRPARGFQGLDHRFGHEGDHAG